MNRDPRALLFAVLATSGTCRDKIKRQDPVMRSGLKPWIPPRELEELQERAKRNAPKTADHFIPRIAYDTLFAALRHVIFKVDRKSATPIAHIIFESCSDAEVVELASGICPIGGRDAHLYELWWQQSEEQKLKHAPYARLRAKIEQARDFHSAQLREHGYEDVDIIYWGSQSNYTFMKADEVEIKKSGGKIYHLYPRDEETCIITISALVRSDVLARLFPAERLDKGDNIIETNTPQAPPAPTLEDGVDSDVQQNDDNSLSKTSSRKDSANEQCQSQETIDTSIEQVCGTTVPDQAENGTKKLPTYLQSIWSPNNVPFSNIDVWMQATFWSVDLPIRKQMLRDWRNDVAEWKRRNPDALPSQSIEDSGYPLAAEMSGLYPSSRNATWYEENVRKEELKENSIAQRHAEQVQRTARERAKRNEYILLRNKANAKVARNRHHLHSQVLIKNVIADQIATDKQLQESLARSVQLREASGVMPAAWHKGLDGKSRPPSPPSPPAPSRSPSPIQEREDEENTDTHTEEPEHLARPMITFAESIKAVWSNDIVPSSVIPNQDLAEPFPKYNDAMAERIQIEEIDHFQPTLLQQLRDEAMIRKATGASIADILSATGVCRDCSGSVVIVPVECIEEDEDEEPSTPTDTPIGVSEEKVLVKSVRFDDAVRGGVANEVVK